MFIIHSLFIAGCASDGHLISRSDAPDPVVGRGVIPEEAEPVDPPKEEPPAKPQAWLLEGGAVEPLGLDNSLPFVTFEATPVDSGQMQFRIVASNENDACLVLEDTAKVAPDGHMSWSVDSFVEQNTGILLTDLQWEVWLRSEEQDTPSAAASGTLDLRSLGYDLTVACTVAMFMDAPCGACDDGVYACVPGQVTYGEAVATTTPPDGLRSCFVPSTSSMLTSIRHERLDALLPEEMAAQESGLGPLYSDYDDHDDETPVVDSLEALFRLLDGFHTSLSCGCSSAPSGMTALVAALGALWAARRRRPSAS